MSATPTEREAEDTDAPEPFQGSSELDGMFLRAIQCGLAATALLAGESILPHLVAAGALERAARWLLRIGGLGLLGATVFYTVAVVAELWRTRRRPPPPPPLSPALERLRTQLLLWTVGGGMLGAGLCQWLLYHFGVEPQSTTDRVLWHALVIGGTYAGAVAWRWWARRQGVSPADVAVVWRTPR